MKPIKVNSDSEVVQGNHRFAAAKAIGIAALPIEGDDFDVRYAAFLAAQEAAQEAEQEAIRLATREGYRLALGIPYAPARFKGKRHFVVCPRCGIWIETIDRKDFESFSGIEYANHYAAEHAVADGRIFVAGRWWEPI